MPAKNRKTGNKIDNRTKIDNKNLDFMPIIQNDIDANIIV